MKKQTILTFLRFILPYVLVMLTILVLGQEIYMNSVKVLSEETMQVQLSTLENSMQVVDRMLSGAENISVELSLEQKYRIALLKMKKRIDNFYDYIDVWKTLNNANFNKEYVLDYVIYFPNNEFLLTSKTASTSPELYYEDQIIYNNMDFEQWDSFLGQADRLGKIYPSSEVKLYRQKQRVLSYVRVVPFDLKEPEAVLQIFIREKDILDAFDDYVQDNHGLVAMLDPDGNILTSKGNYEPLENVLGKLSFEKKRDYLYLAPEKDQKWGNYLVYTVSPESGITYISILPEEIILENVNSVRQEVLGISAIILLIIMFLGFLATFQNVKSVKKISQKLWDFGNRKTGMTDAYSAINENLDSLLASHDRLSVTFQKQASRIINGMTMDLIMGLCGNVEEVLDTVEETGIKVRTKNYCVAIYKIAAPDNLALQKLVVEDAILGQSQNDVLVADYAKDRIAVLFCSDKDSQAFLSMVDKRLHQSTASIHEKGIEGFCVIGPVVESVEDIHKSTAAAARTILNILFDGNVTVYVYDNIYKNYANVLYNFETEQKIINMVKQGNDEGAQKYLQNLISERMAAEDNILKRKSFYLQLCGTLAKIQSEHVRYSELYKRIEQSNNEEDIIRILKDKYSEVTEEYLAQKKNGNSDIILVIQKYIQDHYTDPSLCLAEIAEKFNISEVYFSQTFKNVTGENFSGYLETIRMEQARYLLRNSDKTVEEVSNMVGYNSINTFHKAFKRVNGVTPGAFKKIQ